MAADARCFSVVLERIGRNVLRQLAALPDEFLNHPVPLYGANTIFALATHIAGSTEFYVLELAAGGHVSRDRASEFHARGPRDELMKRYEQWIAAVHGALDSLPDSALEELAEAPEEYRATGGLGEGPLTVLDYLLHAVEHAALHLGQIQIMRRFLEEHSRRLGTC